jgi:hypothetical protein
MGITWPLLAVGLRIGTISSQFELDTDTPDALCPELGMAREAVAKRLGELEVEGNGTWRGRYRIVHDPSGRRGDYVALSIFDPQGAEQLNRELPIQGESCATLVQAMALIIDGYFRDLGQSLPETATANSEHTVPHETVIHAEKSPDNETLVAAPQSRKPRDVKPIVTATPKPQSEPQNASLALIFGAGMESVPRSAAATFGLLAAVTTHWQLALRVGLPFVSRAQTVEPGQAKLYAVPFRLGLARSLSLGENTTVFMSPEVLASVERGWTVGLANEKAAYRSAIGLGARLGFGQRLTTAWTINANVAGDAVFVNPSRFMVEEKPVLGASPVRWSLGLELSRVFF